MVKQYPDKIKEAAIACLFIPSCIIWGSGLFKDTICMFALGWLTYSFHAFFKERRIKLYLIALALLCIYLLFAIKIYILACYLPVLCLQQIFAVVQNIRNKVKQIITALLLLVFLYFGVVYAYNKIEENLGKYSIEKIAEYAKDSKNYFLEITDNNSGSSYNLGDFEPTIPGMLSKFFRQLTLPFSDHIYGKSETLSLYFLHWSL